MIPHAQAPPNLSHPMQPPQPKSQHTIMNPGPQKLPSMHQLQPQPGESTVQINPRICINNSIPSPLEIRQTIHICCRQT